MNMMTRLTPSENLRNIYCIVFVKTIQIFSSMFICSKLVISPIERKREVERQREAEGRKRERDRETDRE